MKIKTQTNHFSRWDVIGNVAWNYYELKIDIFGYTIVLTINSPKKPVGQTYNFINSKTN